MISLSPPQRNLLLTVHVAASVSVLGADIVLLALGRAALRGGDPSAIYPAAHLVGQSLLLPLAAAALVSGIALGILTSWGLLKYWWVTLKLAITTGLTAVVVFVLIPALGTAADLANGTTAGVVTEAQRRLLVAGPTAGSSLLIAAVALAVYKPRWRLRRTVEP